MDSDKTIQSNIERAYVKLLKLGGRGILINNRYILTATHCLHLPYDGPVILGDYCIEEIETYDKVEIKTSPTVAEIVNDIALIGPMDDQTFGKEYDKYIDFCLNAPNVKISYPKSCSIVFFLNQFDKWIEGKITYISDPPIRFWTHFSIDVTAGDSGSGIINEKGEVIGIISNTEASNSDNRKECFAPIIEKTLPVWVIPKLKEKFDPLGDYF